MSKDHTIYGDNKHKLLARVSQLFKNVVLEPKCTKKKIHFSM